MRDRRAQEKVRQHFFTRGGIALQFAVEQTAARIVDRIDGCAGLADSYDVAGSFRTTPTAHRNTVLATLDELTRAKCGQSAAEKAADVLEYEVIAIEVVSGLLAGIVTYIIRAHVLYGIHDGPGRGPRFRQMQTLFGETVVLSKKDLDAIVSDAIYPYILEHK